MASDAPTDKTAVEISKHLKLQSSNSSLFPDYVEGDILVGKYKIEKLIGQGGMGKIYRAAQSNRTVAIKVIRALDNEEATKRFEIEASITANLMHPNTVRIFDFGTTKEGLLFFVMEYLDGLSLKQYLYKNGAFHPSAAAELISQICDALLEAHKKGLIHRDIKPENIMLITSSTEGKQAKLLDFGLAKNLESYDSVTKTGMILGSPMYMSPEQIQQKKATMRSDIYSLGLTLYSMLSGKKPFYDGAISALLRDQISNTPKSLPDINQKLLDSPSLLWIVETAIQKDPQKRFISILQMKYALECFLKEPAAKLQLINGKLLKNGRSIKEANIVLKDISLQGLSEKSTASTSDENTPSFGGIHSVLRSRFLAIASIPRLAVFLLCIGVLFFAISNVLMQKSSVNTIREQNTEKEIYQDFIKEELHLDTIPSGAIVFDEHNNQLSITPLTIRVGESKHIILRLDGYEEETITLSKELTKRTITLKAIPLQK